MSAQHIGQPRLKAKWLQVAIATVTTNSTRSELYFVLCRRRKYYMVFHTMSFLTFSSPAFSCLAFQRPSRIFSTSLPVPWSEAGGCSLVVESSSDVLAVDCRATGSESSAQQSATDPCRSRSRRPSFTAAAMAHAETVIVRSTTEMTQWMTTLLADHVTDSAADACTTPPQFTWIARPVLLNILIKSAWTWCKIGLNNCTQNMLVI